MQILKEIHSLVLKDFRLEFRHTYSIGSVVLYVFSTIFLIYSGFFKIPVQVWNVIYWVILLFAAVNIVLNSFSKEQDNRNLYLYTLVHPISVIIAKIIYNFVILILIALLAYAFLSILSTNPVRDYFSFFIALVMGCMGLSVIFTFIAGISSRGNNQSTLIAVLGFPVIIPVLLILIKISANALGLVQDSAVTSDYLILAGLNLLFVGLSVLLFPFIWKD